MTATILTIGDELLNGDTIDSNSTWIARQLGLIGIDTREIITVADEKKAILKAFQNGLTESNLLICTGGLGPTKDDLTKECFAEFFNLDCKENKQLRKRLEQYYTNRGYDKSHVTNKMVSMPEGATILMNNFGVAPGMWQEKEDKILVALPGIPYEMKGLMKEEILPRLKSEFSLPSIYYHYFMTAGKGETTLAKRLETIEANLPTGFSISYLPSFANVKVRLSAKGQDSSLIEEKLKEIVPQIREKLSPELYSENRNESLVKALAGYCTENQVTIGSVESCTGGNIAHEITALAGSSSYYSGSIVSYSNDIKKNVIGVQSQTLENYGAVSEETIREMVKGGLYRLNCDYVVATSGIAGPGGGTKQKPVGLIWIGVGNSKKVKTKCFNFTKKREKNIQLFTMMALNELFRFIKEQEIQE